jgi:hypothetical protein
MGAGLARMSKLLYSSLPLFVSVLVTCKTMDQCTLLHYFFRYSSKEFTPSHPTAVHNACGLIFVMYCTTGLDTEPIFLGSITPGLPLQFVCCLPLWCTTWTRIGCWTMTTLTIVTCTTIHGPFYCSPSDSLLRSICAPIGWWIGLCYLEVSQFIM